MDFLQHSYGGLAEGKNDCMVDHCFDYIQSHTYKPESATAGTSSPPFSVECMSK